jgi:hypothetical protein
VRVAAALLVVSLGAVWGPCRRAGGVGVADDGLTSAPAIVDCTGAAPACYTPRGDGCCDEPAVPAVCGPKDAPKGTHLKWICEGTLTPATACRGVGSGCVGTSSGAAPFATAAPHAVVPLIPFDPDASAPADSGGRDAGPPRRRKR